MIKNYVFTSRATDLKVLEGLSIVIVLGLSALTGYWLPAPFEAPHVQLADAVLTFSALCLVWSLFHVLVPMRYIQYSKTGVNLASLAAWILIVVAIGFWFSSQSAKILEEESNRLCPLGML